MERQEKSEDFFKKGVQCDNAQDLGKAIRFYSKSIRLTKHPKAFYNRACIYKDQWKYKKAIKDFKSYLKHGPTNSREASASEISIRELENIIAKCSSVGGKSSNYPCPRCKSKFIIVGNGHFPGSIALRCPRCGLSMIKLKP